MSMEIAQELADLCRQGKNLEAIEKLYSSDIVSIEACAMEGMPQEMKGIDAIKGKNQWWTENHEVHSGDVTGPFPNGDRFVLIFKYDVTHKPTGNRMAMEEAGLFTVKNGKIAKEEFFYSMG